MNRPLKPLWSVNIGHYIGYPVIANGVVVIAADFELLGLDEKTGKTLWTQPSPRGRGWVGPAYENGTIFVSPFATTGRKVGMYAFDERTGRELWSSVSPRQKLFTSPPTAANGIVYTSAEGYGGTLYAYDEKSGKLDWSMPVNGGGGSSPLATPTGVFVSYACPQTYKFDPDTGRQKWQFSGGCDGGGGSTPVLYGGRLFVGDSDYIYGFSGLVLSPGDGKVLGKFNANYPPAFASNIGFFVNYTTLKALSIPTMKQLWEAKVGGSNTYSTPPLVVGSVVYIVTAYNQLLGFDLKAGTQVVNIQLTGAGGFNYSPTVGMGYGDGELVVPTGFELNAFAGS